jgi:hypothetical protein
VKQHCDGFRGWFDGPCPSPDFVLAPGQSFTAEQQVALGTIILAMLLVAVVLLVVVAAATLADG